MASEFLTPYDELIESTQLGERRMQAANALNPLYQRDQAILAKGAGVPVPPVPESRLGGQPVTAVPTAVASNPLIRPPVPLSTMPVDKQIAWEKQQQESLGRQAELDRAALETTSLRRKEELDREGVKQATALLGETGSLKPDDLVNYPLQRGELARKYPAGAMSPEAKNILSYYDTVHANALQMNKELMGRQDQASIQRDAQRREGGEKMAASLGADTLSKFYELEKTQGTESAIQGVMADAAKIKRDNIEATLLNSGMTAEEIQKKFTGPSGEFLYGTAEAQAKVRVNPQQEASAVRQDLIALRKQRDDAVYEPGIPNEQWSEDDEKLYQNTRKIYNTHLGRAINRLGLQGYDPNANAVPTPTPSPAPVARPSATPSSAAAARPTPTPPPLNPKYEEGWKNGQRYIKMSDGQWHLSKVQ